MDIRTPSRQSANAHGWAAMVRVRVTTWSVCAVVAAGLIVLAYFLPLWTMTLKAPQYPNDLHLTAYGTTMKGDLQEINSLNHYAGVKAIVPGDVFEFTLFPFALFGCVALVLVAAALGHRLLRWGATLAVWGLAIGFLIDLQYWLYNFGHELLKEAPLYPGPFTPKVLGRTKVVNFHSECMVTWGWWALFGAALLLTFGPVLARFVRDSWQNTGTPRAAAAAAGVLLLATAVAAPNKSQAAGDLTVLVRDAAPGSTLVIPAGQYRGPLVIDKPLTLIGLDWPVIDGQGAGDVVRITAENVTLRGFVVQGSGREVSDEPSGVRVLANNATIEQNRLRDVLYGVSLHDSDGHVVRGNDIQSFHDFAAERRGHALYLYYTKNNLLENNTISYAKDGVFINFSENNRIINNRVTHLRYGIHFMYANSNIMSGNVFRNNLTGGSIMYSKDLTFERNEFAYNRSAASGYGVLFKDVDSIRLIGNLIHHNRLGITMEGAPMTPGSFVTMEDNLIGFNQVGLQLSTTVGAQFGGNTFAGNLRQVEEKGGSLDHHNVWEIDGRGNHWDDYRGYDADGDGTGDIAYHYRAAYGELMQQDEGLKAFNNTPAQMAIDLASRWFPAYRGAPSITDRSPLMRPTIRLAAEGSGTSVEALGPLALLVLFPMALFVFAGAARRGW